MFSVARCDEAGGMGWGGNWEAMDDNAANKIATADGSETWELLTPGAGPGYRSCVQYVPNTDCQSICCGHSISRSSDGGATWTTEADSNFYTVRFTPGGQWQLAGRSRVPAVRPNTDHFTDGLSRLVVDADDVRSGAPRGGVELPLGRARRRAHRCGQLAGGVTFCCWTPPVLAGELDTGLTKTAARV